MTRFEQEISGALGNYWKVEAEKELARIERELAEGKITIDKNGVARNCIGRVLMDDMIEKVAYVSTEINKEATREARSIEVDKELAEYRRNYKGPSAEELYEMQSAFGKGTVVVDVITGKRIQL